MAGDEPEHVNGLFRNQWGRVEVIRGSRIGRGRVTPPARGGPGGGPSSLVANLDPLRTALCGADLGAIGRSIEPGIVWRANIGDMTRVAEPKPGARN